MIVSLHLESFVLFNVFSIIKCLPMSLCHDFSSFFLQKIITIEVWSYVNLDRCDIACGLLAKLDGSSL